MNLSSDVQSILQQILIPESIVRTSDSPGGGRPKVGSSHRRTLSQAVPLDLVSQINHQLPKLPTPPRVYKVLHFRGSSQDALVHETNL